MGKRSNFERRKADFYLTPRAAVLPLIHLKTTRRTAAIAEASAPVVAIIADDAGVNAFR
jgi:hypothetical protein